MKAANLNRDAEFEAWARKFKNLALRDRSAGRSWKRLIDLGFDEDLVSLGFYLACDFPDSPGYEELAELREESRRTIRQAKRLISRLVSDRDEVCRLLKIRTDAPVPKPETEISAQSTPDSDLMEEVKAIFREAGYPDSESMPLNGTESGLAAETRAPGPSHSDGHLTSGPGNTASKDALIVEGFDAAIEKLRLLQDEVRMFASKRTASPAFFVALGISLIKGSANQPLYRDYANLLNVAYEVFERDDILTGEDAVRKAYQRFMKRNPDAFKIELHPLAILAVIVVLYFQATSKKNPETATS